MPIDPRGIAGLGARDCGQPVLSGALLELDAKLDRAFRDLARCWSAAEYRFPPFLRAEHLDRLDYFRSFPHLATFPVQARRVSLDVVAEPDLFGLLPKK